MVGRRTHGDIEPPLPLLPHHVRFLHDCDDGTLAHGPLPAAAIPERAQAMADRALALIRHPLNELFVPDYAADVQGASAGDHAAYRGRLVALCATLLGLPDERHVRLAAAPDVFCGACAVGAHCRRLAPEGEEYCARTFLQMARALGGRRAGGRDVWAVAAPGDGRGTVIETTFGTVRAVLRYVPSAGLPGWVGWTAFATAS